MLQLLYGLPDITISIAELAVDFLHVKSHEDNDFNEVADLLANTGRHMLSGGAQCVVSEDVTAYFRDVSLGK
eukprot:349897-Karenia_brevis.AAC.1